MQFVKRVGPLCSSAAIGHKSPPRRDSPRLAWVMHLTRWHAPGDATQLLLLLLLPPLATCHSSSSSRRQGGEPDERPCWQFFMHLTIEATTTTSTLPCPVLARLHSSNDSSIHPSIYSFNSPAARSLAHSCAEVFIQLLVRSFIHSLCCVLAALGTCWQGDRVTMVESALWDDLEMCKLWRVIDNF